MNSGIFSGGATIISKLILPFCFGLLGGAWGASLFEFEMTLWILGVACIFLMLIVKSKFAVIIFLVFGWFLGVGFATQEIDKTNDPLDEKFAGVVRIKTDPTRKEGYQQLVVEPIGKDRNRYLVFTSLYAVYRQNDLIDLSCELEKPQNRDQRFDYVRFLAKDGIYGICKTPTISKIEGGKSSNLEGFVFAARRSVEQKIGMLLPSPESSYLAGLLLGGSDRLPPKIAKAFQLTGTTHVVAVSGYNITIVASAVGVLLIFLGLWRGQAFWFSALAVLLFVYAIGAPASAVRAAIMGICILWATKNGRLASSGRALILAATIMVLWSPLVLVYDVGFQLSFLATMGIVYIYGPLSKKFKVTKDFLELKSIVLVTFAAQIAVVGIIIYQFGVISPYSLLVNFIILPIIPLIMLLGFLMILTSYLSLFLANLLGQGVWTLLHFEIAVVEFFSHLPGVSMRVENIGPVWLFAYYLFIGGVVIYLQKPHWLYNEKK